MSGDPVSPRRVWQGLPGRRAWPERPRPERLRPARPATPVRPVTAAAVAALLAVYPLVLTTQFWRNAGVVALVFAIAAMGWNILGGYTGQISFGNAVFFGAGGYATALGVRAGWSPWLGMLAGAAVAAAAGVVIGFPCFRLRSHYFAIATIAVGEIADIVVTANARLGASSGMDLPVRANSLADLQFPPDDTAAYYYVALALTAAAGVVMWLFGRARTGAYARAVRDDEDAAKAAGVPSRRYKLYAVAVSGAVTAVAGGFYVMYDLFVDPSLVLDLSVSITVVLMVIFGGSGTFWGPLLGAWALTILRQVTLQGSGSSVSGLDLLIYGALIVVVVIVEPGGLVALGRRAAALAGRGRRPASAGAASAGEGGPR